MKRFLAGLLSFGLVLAGPGAFAEEAASPAPLSAETISLNFKGAEIGSVLQALARKGGVNIVVGPEVSGTITLELEDVTWQQALDAVVRMTGYAYEKNENVVMVSTLEEILARHAAMQQLAQTETIATKIVQLRYLDAADVVQFLEPQLSPQGRISVLEMTGQKGWTFGAAEAGGSGAGENRSRRERENARSKALVITDTPSTIQRLERVLNEIDVMPKQVLIQARVMEVNSDLLRDLGMEIGTGSGSTAVSTRSATQQPIDKVEGQDARATLAGSVLNQAISPSIFVPEATGLTAINTGLDLVLRKLRGTQVELLLRALEEDVKTNTLSAPHILTLSGQEARILIGEKFPILSTEISGTSTAVTTTSLDYYQDIGIELFVVPQVAGDGHIDMIIHPVVSARNGSVGANNYPILNVREAETQVVVENGETIVIGGLLKDVKSHSRTGLPFLGKVPVLKYLFSRETHDTEKIDLLIFITASRIEPGALSPDEALQLQHQYQAQLQARFEKATGAPKEIRK